MPLNLRRLNNAIRKDHGSLADRLMYEAKNEGGDAFLERLDLRLPRYTRHRSGVA
jgi:hypothetical protein